MSPEIWDPAPHDFIARSSKAPSEAGWGSFLQHRATESRMTLTEVLPSPLCGSKLAMVLTSKPAELEEAPGWRPSCGLKQWDSGQAWKWCPWCHLFDVLLARIESHGGLILEAGEYSLAESQEERENLANLWWPWHSRSCRIRSSLLFQSCHSGVCLTPEHRRALLPVPHISTHIPTSPLKQEYSSYPYFFKSHSRSKLQKYATSSTESFSELQLLLPIVLFLPQSPSFFIFCLYYTCNSYINSPVLP